VALDTIAVEGLKTTPGYMNVYCNDGFTLLEALIPAVAGKSYEQYIRDEVLTPLGMAHTRFPTVGFPDGAQANPGATVTVAAARTVLDLEALLQLR